MRFASNSLRPSVSRALLEKTSNGWIDVAGKQAYGARLFVDKELPCVAPCRAEVPLAGVVQVASGPALATKLAPVRRQSPSGGDAFGVDVEALPFCASGCGAPAAVVDHLALVGSGSHAFTFFTLASGGVDPRKP